MWIFPRGSQPWHRWHTMAGGLFSFDAVSNDRWNAPVHRKKEGEPSVSAGEVLYTPLPKARRRGTNVVGILQAVGPRNTELTKRHRDACAVVVANIVKKCLAFAKALKAQTIVMSGISTGIFADHDRKFAAAMRGAMLRVLNKYFSDEATPPGVRVVIIGRNWNEVI